MKWKWRRRADPAAAELVVRVRRELDRDCSTDGRSEDELFHQRLMRAVFMQAEKPPSRWTGVLRRVGTAWKALSQEKAGMRNLAGRLDCDGTIARELSRARIEVVQLDRPVGDVLSRIRGRVGPIEFARAPTCYVAEGPVTIEVARYLFDDPVGRREALVHGIYDRPAPGGPWVAWYTTEGARVYPCEQESAFRETQARWPEAFVDAAPLAFHDHPEQIGAMGFVDYYHLVSEDGLHVFASALRRYSVDQRTLPWWWDRHRRMSARSVPFSAEVDTQEMNPEVL